MSFRFFYQFFAWIYFLVPVVVLSQAPKLVFKHITTEQGLSNSNIETIFQDSRGYMWFGTRDGLNRYDGYQMTVYRKDVKDSNSISDNYISCIYEGKDHIIWVGTVNGLNAFDAAKNRFTRYKHQDGDAGTIPHNQVSAIAEDKTGNLWVGTFGGGLSRFDPKDKTFNRFPLSDNRVNCIFRDARSNFWIGTEKGLDLFEPGTGKFTFYKTPANSGIMNIAGDKNGNLWLGTQEKGLLKFQPEQMAFQWYRHQPTNKSSLGSNQVRCILADKKGKIWTGGVNAGLNLLDDSTNSFFNYQDDPGDAFSLSQRTITALYEDNQGNLWVGTHRGGINLSTPTTLKFTLFRSGPDKNSLSHNDIRSFCEDKRGNIWIATAGGGLNLFNRQAKSFKRFRHNPYDSGTIASNNVLNVIQDNYGNLWISTSRGGLDLLRAGSKFFEHFIHKSSDSGSISSNNVQLAFEDHNKKLWVATYYGGLNLYNRVTKNFTRLDTSADGKTRLQGNNIVSLAEDKKGNLWIGTDDGGLNSYNLESKSFSHYFNTEEKLPDLRVLFTDSKGRLWVGQAGLYLYDEAKNEFALVTDQAGLGTAFIKGIREDAEGYLWISTSSGITQFHPERKTFKNYDVSDGLQGSEFEANACLKTKDGEMFFGGVNGFNSFYPSKIRINPFVPPVTLTEFKIFNKKILPSEDGPLQSDISVAKTIKLDYRQSAISFGFVALNFTASENNQYAYKLQGLQDDWNYVGTDTKASFTNLDPGTYTFRVKASNNDGVWNEQGAAIKIIITPPYWQAWWFRTLIALAFFSAIIAYYQFRKNQVIRKLEANKREEIHQMQLQFFTNISHEFRTPLSLVLAPLEKLEKENNQPAFVHHTKLMHRNVNRMLESINELVDFNKAESGALKLKVMPGNLSLFLAELEEEFRELANERKLQFDISVPEKLGEVCFDRLVLEKIINNLVSNAFKYTPDGGSVLVEVLSSLKNFQSSFPYELRIKNNYRPKRAIYLRVADNGVGIAEESLPSLFDRYYRITDAHMGSGVGLAFVKTLTLLHKGSIKVYSEQNKGTEIIIALPANREDYTKEEKWIRNTDAGVQLETISNKYEYSVVGESTNNTTPGAYTPQENQCILVVDDRIELKNFIKERLGNYYKVIEANDGKEGLAKAKEHQPDLIICDMMVPVMDGIEFCKRLKEDIIISHIPFIMLTARDAPIEGTGSGADYYFSKPVSVDLLVLTIRNIFEQKQRLKDRYVNDYHAEAKDLVHSSKDKEFIKELLANIEMQLSNPELDVEYVCTNVGLSRTRLYQKIKSITGLSIGDFVRTIRLRKAIDIMTHEDVPLPDVMFRVGIQTQSYFTKAFKKESGKTPVQFLQELKK